MRLHWPSFTSGSILGSAIAMLVLGLTISVGPASRRQAGSGTPANHASPGPVRSIPRLNPEQIVAEAEQSVAVVRGKSASGTGFLVADHVLVTNAHVVSGEFLEDLSIRFPSADVADQAPQSVELLYEDRGRDLTFLKVASKLPPLRIAESYRFRRGQEITVIGNPGAGGVTLENAVSRGIMSTRAKLNGLDFYQLGVSINPGNSGGPVFDSTGQVIGVATLKAAQQDGMAFCIPLEDLRRSIADVQLQTHDLQEAVSQHRVCVVFERLSEAGNLYVAGLELYKSAMEKAIGAGFSAADGLKVATDSMQPTMSEVDRMLAGDLESALASISRDPHIKDELRSKIAQLWTNYQEMKSYLRSPTGSYNTYTEKAAAFKATHSRIVDQLKLVLNAPSQ